MSSNNQVIPIDERLDFYLNEPQEKKNIILDSDIYQGKNLTYKSQKALFNYKKYKGTFYEWYCLNLMPLFPFKKLRALPFFKEYRHLLTLSDFIKAFSNSSTKTEESNFLFYHGEKGNPGSETIY